MINIVQNSITTLSKEIDEIAKQCSNEQEFEYKVNKIFGNFIITTEIKKVNYSVEGVNMEKLFIMLKNGSSFSFEYDDVRFEGSLVYYIKNKKSVFSINPKEILAIGNYDQLEFHNMTSLPCKIGSKFNVSIGDYLYDSEEHRCVGFKINSDYSIKIINEDNNEFSEDEILFIK